MSLTDRLNKWQACDDARDSAPGEHLMVAAAGGALIVSALFAPSAFRATLRAMLGGALLVRAASGRDGLACLMPKTPEADKPGNPWPFPKSAEPARPSEPANPPAEAAPYDGA